MMVVKPLTDLGAIDNLLDFAKESGIGFTTLPVDPDFLSQQLLRSKQAFSEHHSKPVEQYYLFGLFDTERNVLAGIAAITSQLGEAGHNYQYKLIKVKRYSEQLNLRLEYDYLKLVKVTAKQSELCSLFLSQPYRKGHWGALLSRARLLFMAQHPGRFHRDVFAEIRGVSDEEGISPFWQSLGNHFFGITFAEADRKRALTNGQFIADLMPRGKIYTALLSKYAQDVIAEPHVSSRRALELLAQEGFSYHNHVHIFDAGPIIGSAVENLKTVKDSRVVMLAEIGSIASGRSLLVSNLLIDARIMYADCLMVSDDKIRISPEVASALEVSVGDWIRIVE